MGIKDWFGGDKKKQAYREKVKEAVADGKLSNTDMQELSQLQQELDVTDAADDKTSLRRDLYNDAVDAARSKGQLTQTGVQDLAKIQKFLALRDDQIEKTKIEVNRLRTLTEIRRGNLPAVPPTHTALRGVQMEAGEVPHYSLAVELFDQPRIGNSEGMRVQGEFKYSEGGTRSHFLPEEGAKPLGEGNVIITNRRVVLKTGEGRTASVRFDGTAPFYLYNEGLRLPKSMGGSTLLKFKTRSDDTAEIVGELLAALTKPELT